MTRPVEEAHTSWLASEPTMADVPESQRHRVCFCKVADGRMHLRATDCERRFPCLPSLGEHCGNCHRCTSPEEADR